MIKVDLTYHFELTKDHVFRQYCGEIDNFITKMDCILLPMQTQVLNPQVMVV